MDMLSQILGNQRQEFDDFVSRYDEGAPWDGIRDDEALERYRQVSPGLSDDQYRDSAREAFSRLTPQQRAEFGRWLQHQSLNQGRPVDYLSDARGFEDPDVLAGASARIHREQPGLLEGLLAGATGGASTRAGMQAPGAGGDLLSSPIAKAVLGGIAAMAASRVMGRR